MPFTFSLPFALVGLATSRHPDVDNDGIVDDPRPIDGGNNYDNCPLVIREQKMTPIEYFRSLKPAGKISKQNVVQATQDYFNDEEIPEIGRRLKKRDVVNLIRAYFERVLP